VVFLFAKKESAHEYPCALGLDLFRQFTTKNQGIPWFFDEFGILLFVA